MVLYLEVKLEPSAHFEIKFLLLIGLMLTKKDSKCPALMV